jgi:hypothetical protein
VVPNIIRDGPTLVRWREQMWAIDKDESHPIAAKGGATRSSLGGLCHGGHAAFHLFFGDVFHMRGDGPAMAEGIDEVS